MSGEDDRVTAQLRERIEAKRRLKQREYEKLAAKSFILNDPEINKQQAGHPVNEEELKMQRLEGNITELIRESRKKQNFVKQVESAPWYSKDKLNYFIHKHPMVFTTMLLECNLLILTYPLQAIKTRVQSRHKDYDLCHFMKNGVEKAPMLQGVSNAFSQVLIGNFVHYFVNKFTDYYLLKDKKVESYLGRKLLSYTAADLLSSPFRMFFEVRKSLRLMNVPEITAAKHWEAFRLGLGALVVRDFLFRVVFETIYHKMVFHEYYSKLHQQRMIGLQVEDTLAGQLQHEGGQKIHTRSGLFIFATGVAAIVSHPFDVALTRLICQQKRAYGGLFECLRTMWIEEGWKKLCLSGFGPRAGFVWAQGTLMMAFAPRLLPLVEEAYSLENLIN